MPAAAAPLQPGTYRIFLEAQPAYALAPPVTASRPVAQAGRDDGADISGWELALIAYRPAGPIFQLRNATTRMCLQPRRIDAVSYSVGQDVCTVDDAGLWFVARTAGNYRISLASDSSLTVYADTAQGTALLGRVGDQPHARWILHRQ
ncbi:RICIN domain-containing protein [Nocardia blacklockiae]|nr:RICIN domain-containing protein [Nocardia blacklockiae]